MKGQPVHLIGPQQRDLAKRLIDVAPDNAIVTIREASRSLDQNALMWVLLGDISRAKPDGRRWTPEVWKCAFMQSLGHQVQFCEGLDDSGPFPIGFRSSRLTVRQMADLITVIQEYGDRHGIRWTERMVAA
jgi:hypothetical protein